jgi:hypothetical protein
VSWYWGNPNSWTINCDKTSYFPPNTCLPVRVQTGAKQLDGPALAVGVFVAIYANPQTANGTTGITAQWFRTSKTPFPGSTLPDGYTGPIATPAPGSTATPAPTQTTPPATGANTLPGVYTQIFSNSTPFHTTVAQHKANGAAILPQSAMNYLWSEGISGQEISPTSYYPPIYVSSAADPIKTFTCTGYGACNANGLRIHVPNGAQVEPHSDGHIAVIDTVLNTEVDGWQCAVNTSTLACTWGGQYPFGGSGLANSGSEAVHAGYAAGLMAITAQELLNGHVDHALGINTECLNNPTVYPADLNATGTDESCNGNGPPVYGDLVHLRWTAAQIASSAYSGECKTILTAFATYGAYTHDTGGLGLSFDKEASRSFTALGRTDPWAGTLLPRMVANGDATGGGSTFYWNSCLNRLSAADLELIQIPVGIY